MKRACIVSVVALALVATGIAVGARVALRGGISARVEPGRLETSVARRARNFLIPGSARDVPNPVALTPETLAEGRTHFASHCATCHGNDGSGRTEMGRNLYPRAPDMRAEPTQSLTDGELFYLIENGIRFTGMPAWGGAGEPEESWKLVHFVRSLPSLGPAQIAEMRSENPRSRREWEELEEEDAFLRGGAPGGDGSHARHGR